jgi:hypothetical protein
MASAEKLALLASGVFFLNALLTGTWKYLQIRTSPDALAHPYTDIAHRASLLYSFAALLLARFVELSPYSNTVELWAVALPLLFFAGAIVAYMIHGALRDTDNQLRTPHVLGSRTLSPASMTAWMVALIVAEIGGFLVLFVGFLQAEFF